MMKNQFQRITLLILIIFTFLAPNLLAQRATTRAKAAPKDTVLVVIGTTEITTNDLRQKINTLPAMYRHRYKSINGQKEILDRIVIEQVFFAEALKAGYDKNDEVKKAINQALRPVINQIFFDEVLDKELKISQRDLENFYNANRTSYMIAPKVTIQHLQIDESDLSKVQQEINANNDFSKIIAAYSKNEFSANNGGYIRNIRLNGFITGIGRDTDLDKHIADANIDPNFVNGPFRTSTGIHYFKKIDYEPTVIRTFDEVRAEIENRLRSQKQNEIYVELMDKLRVIHNVRFHTNRLDTLNVLNVLPQQRGIIIAESNLPEMTITFGEVGQILRNAAATERMNINDPAIRENLIKREIDSRLLYAHALSQGALEKHKNRFEIKEVKMTHILRHWFNEEITNKVVVTQDEIDKYYAENTDKYTIPASRNIRQFVFENERAAKRHHKAVARHLRRNQEDRIIALLRKESVRPEGDGLLRNIYQNNIVPGLGQDETYNQKIWQLKVNELSDIFRNRNDEIVFFYVVEETPASVRPLEDVYASLHNIIRRRKANEDFETMKETLIAKYKAFPNYDLLVSRITAQQLFDLAEEAQKKFAFTEAIFYFDQIISDFKDTDDAYKAHFMKAFLTSEELKDKAKAIELFEEMLAKYPSGDLNDSAKFMLEALKTDIPIEQLISE